MEVALYKILFPYLTVGVRHSRANPLRVGVALLYLETSLGRFYIVEHVV